MRLISRVRNWWDRPPEITDEMLEAPIEDPRLTEEMTDVAALAQAIDPRLDQSVRSVDTVDAILTGRLTPLEVYLLGAYVGEVLRSEAPVLQWVLDPGASHDPHLGLGKRMFDPFSLTERRTRRRSDTPQSLGKEVEDLLVFVRDPSEAVHQRLGWTGPYFPTQWEQLQDQRVRRRRRRMRELATSLT